MWRLGVSSAVLCRALLLLPFQLPEWKIHGVQRSPGQHVFYCHFWLRSYQQDSYLLPCRNTELRCRGMGWGCYHFSSAHCQVKENPTCWPDREEFKGMYGSVPLLTAEYRDQGSKLFFKAGEVGKNLAAAVPRALAAMFPWK